MDENQQNPNETTQEYDHSPQYSYSQSYPEYDQTKESDRSVPRFFMQLPYSFQPPKYANLMRVKNGAMIGFIVLLLFVLTVLSYGYFLVTVNLDKVFRDTLDKTPDFSLKNGVFEIEQDVLYEDVKESVYLEIVNRDESFTLPDAESVYNNGKYEEIVLISKNNLIYVDNGMKYQQIDFKDFSTLSLDKDWILNQFVPMLSVIIAIGYIFYFIGRCLWYFFCAMIYMLLSMIFAKIFHREIAAEILYKTSVYAKVLMTVVAFVVSIIPVSFSIPPYIRTFITIGMIVFAFQFLPEKYETGI